MRLCEHHAHKKMMLKNSSIVFVFGLEHLATFSPRTLGLFPTFCLLVCRLFDRVRASEARRTIPAGKRRDLPLLTGFVVIWPGTLCLRLGFSHVSASLSGSVIPCSRTVIDVAGGV